MSVRTRRSSANVFQDLGFYAGEAAKLEVRADLMIQLARLIEARGLTQAAAAKLLGVAQRRISDLVRGKIDRFSIDRLVEMLGRADARVSFVVKFVGLRVPEILATPIPEILTT